MKNSTSARLLLSPTLWPRNAFVWWGSLLLALVLAAAAFGALLVVGAFVVATHGVDALRRQNPAVSLAIQFTVYVPMVLVMLAALPMLARRSLRELGLRKPTLAEIGWGVAGALLMFTVISIAGALEERVLHLKISETAVDLLKSAHGPILVAFAAFACIVAPFVEELIFRGFLLNAFLRYTPPVVAVLLSAIVFGLAHLDPHSAAATFPLAAGGLVLGTVYYRTGSLVSSMIAHGTFNLISVIGLVVFHAS